MNAEQVPTGPPTPALNRSMAAPGADQGASQGLLRVLLVDDQLLVRSGFSLILSVEDDIEVVGQAADGQAAIELARQTHPDVVLMDVQMPVLDGIQATSRIVAENLGKVIILTTFDRDDYLFDALVAGASGFLLKNADPDQLVEAVRAVGHGHALLAPEVTRRVIERMVTPTTPGPPASRTDSTGLTRRPSQSTNSGTPDARVQTRASSGRDLPGAPVTGGLADPGASAGGAPPGAGFAAAAGAGPTTPPSALAHLTDREREVLSLVARGMSNAEIAGELFLGEATVKTHVSSCLSKLHLRDRVQAVVLAYEVGLVHRSH